MKKLIGSIGLLFLIGCSSQNSVNLDVNKNLQEVNKDKILMDKYQITSDSLVKFGNFYIFAVPSSNGTNVVFIDKFYNEKKRVIIPYFVPKKVAVSDNKIYLIGTNEEKYYPEFVVINSNGKIIKKVFIPQKYALSKDVYLKNNNAYILIDVYKNGKSYIEIYKNGKLFKKLELKNSINGNFVFKANGDLFVVGTIKNKDEDAFIINLNKGWIRTFDLGMDESFTNYKIDKNKIILNLHSTDEMGADSDYELIIDTNGKILKNKCKVKFNPLPVKFRT